MSAPGTHNDTTTAPGGRSADLTAELAALLDAYGAAVEFIKEGFALVDELRDGASPTPPDRIEHARLMIRTIREGLQQGDPMRTRVMDLRDMLVAAVYANSNPRVPTAALARDAGFRSDSYVSRVATAHGAPQRTHRPSRKGGD